MDEQQQIRAILLSYISLLAELHEKAIDDGIEYDLWDEVQQDGPPWRLIDHEQRDELRWLIAQSHCWATYDLMLGMLQIIDLDEWHSLLARRAH